MRNRFVVAAIAVLFSAHAVAAAAEPGPLVMTRADYEDKVQAAWLGQIIGVLVTFPYRTPGFVGCAADGVSQAVHVGDRRRRLVLRDGGGAGIRDLWPRA